MTERKEVKAIVYFREDGTMIPLQLISKNGAKCKIDKVTAIVPAAAQKTGGNGDRYTIMVKGREWYLFFERNESLTGNNIGKWFIGE